jgi:hypothetical protein
MRQLLNHWTRTTGRTPLGRTSAAFYGPINSSLSLYNITLSISKRICPLLVMETVTYIRLIFYFIFVFGNNAFSFIEILGPTMQKQITTKKTGFNDAWNWGTLIKRSYKGTSCYHIQQL